MGFIPPLNLGSFQPSPATLSQWIYQIWQYLQENPIATQEQLQEYIGTFITTSPETQTMIGEGVEQYLTENPPTAPVQSVQGKTGAVQLAYNEIVPASNAVPVYKASSTPSTNTLTGQYNLGYRLFVNTTTQEIFTISPTGALSLVGRGKFDGTSIDMDSAEGDTTIKEAVDESITTLEQTLTDSINALSNIESTTWVNNGVTFTAERVGRVVFVYATAGTLTSAVPKDGVLAVIPERYRFKTITFIHDRDGAVVTVTSSSGEIKATQQGGCAAGYYLRFYACGIARNE